MCGRRLQRSLDLQQEPCEEAAHTARAPLPRPMEKGKLCPHRDHMKKGKYGKGRTANAGAVAYLQN